MAQNVGRYLYLTTYMLSFALKVKGRIHSECEGLVQALRPVLR